MFNLFIKFCATFGFVGYLKGAPGTLGTLAAVAVACLTYHDQTLYILATVVITAVGFYASGKMEGIVGKKDPGCVVIDEASGLMISLFMLPMTPAVVVTAFFLFRAFDMFKIYPMDRLEDAGGGFGIMMDDIVAGIYTNLVMQIALRLAVG